ncbi:MAG: hypothetical protein VKN33_01195 [Candidatus Sericytochromatia bacterium]|nr:hypothetical protein [Candidatus Sericytochromatia bacterium]
MELLLIVTSAVSAWLGAYLYGRYTERRDNIKLSTRNVETERIIALLSVHQPGIWDSDELRAQMQRVAEEFWSAPTPEALEVVKNWVREEMVETQLSRWPTGAMRREVAVTFEHPPAFVHVQEGDPGPDRVIARLSARIAQDFINAEGRCIRTERHPAWPSFHHWVHIDGRGWQLEAITETFPRREGPPQSSSCNIKARESRRAEPRA